MFIESGSAFFFWLLVTAVAISVLGLLHYFLIHRDDSLTSEERLPRQLLLLALTIVAVIVLVIVAPFAEATRTQILTLLGIVFSGVIAFSSTSFVTNFMAAVVLRVTKPFRVGDFITVGDHFGKVVARGLLDTEIQTDTRELVAIPNSTFIRLPTVVARRSGIIISSTLSLGYDLAYSTIEPFMIEAANQSGLKDPYIHLISLGDFAVTYKVCGLLVDVERILTARSELNRCLLDSLHGAGIEIVSPTITRHINLNQDVKLIPESVQVTTKKEVVEAEAIAFDKARARAELEAEKDAITEKLAAAENMDKSEINSLQRKLETIKEKEKVLKTDTD